MKHAAARILALGLALFTLVGCSSGAALPAAGGSKPVELTLLGWMGMNIESMQAIIEAYTKKHPNVHITMKDASMGQMMVKSDQVNTAMLDGVDVAILPQDLAASYQQAGMLKELTTLRLPALDGAAASLLEELGKANGQRYGVPLSLTPALVVLNGSALQKAGIKPPTLDWTIQDLEQLLSATKAAGQKLSLPQMVMLDPLVRAYGGHLYDSNQHAWTLDTPEVKQGLAEAAKLTQGGWLEGGGIGIELGPNAPALMIVPADAPLPGGNIGTLLPLPKGPKGRETPVSATLAVVNKSSANADVAADFVREMLANPAAQLALAKAGIRPVTADQAAMAAWRAQVGDQTAQAYDLMLQGAYPSPAMKFYVPLMQGLAPYLNGTSSLEQILPGLQSALPH